MTVTIFVSPSLNANGMDRPIGFAAQIDSLTTQSSYFIPPSVPGTLPDAWDGNDGWVANAIVSVPMKFAGLSPGAHTLKVRAQ